MAGSHGRELWFDTDLGDEYYTFNSVGLESFFFSFLSLNKNTILMIFALIR